VFGATSAVTPPSPPPGERIQVRGSAVRILRVIFRTQH
jgi:hypothetical protein